MVSQNSMVGAICLCINVLLWCSWHIVGRSLVDQISPLTILAYRCTFASPILLAIACSDDPVGLKRAISNYFGRLLMLGLLLIVGNCLLFILGLKWTSASEAALLQPLITIFTILLPTVFSCMRKYAQQYAEHTTQTRVQKVGIGFCVIGAMLIVVSRTTVPNSLETLMTHDLQIYRLLGFLCLIGNTVCFSIYVWFQSLLVSEISPTAVTACSYVFVTPIIVLISLFWEYVQKTQEWLNIDRYQLIVLAYVGIFPTGIAALLYAYANKILHPPICGLSSVVQPLVTCILSFVFLHEQLSLQQLLAAACIVVGLTFVLTNRQ